MTSNLIGLGLVWRNKVPRANKECPLTIFVLLFPGSLREENTWRFAAVLVLARVPVRAVIKYYMTSSHLAQPNPHPSLPLPPHPPLGTRPRRKVILLHLSVQSLRDHVSPLQFQYQLL